MTIFSHFNIVTHGSHITFPNCNKCVSCILLLNANRWSFTLRVWFFKNLLFTLSSIPLPVVWVSQPWMSCHVRGNSVVREAKLYFAVKDVFFSCQQTRLHHTLLDSPCSQFSLLSRSLTPSLPPILGCTEDRLRILFYLDWFFLPCSDSEGPILCPR